MVSIRLIGIRDLHARYRNHLLECQYLHAISYIYLC